jgi:hypothetical protein
MERAKKVRTPLRTAMTRTMKEVDMGMSQVTPDLTRQDKLNRLEELEMMAEVLVRYHFGAMTSQPQQTLIHNGRWKAMAGGAGDDGGSPWSGTTSALDIITATADHHPQIKVTLEDLHSRRNGGRDGGSAS